MRLRFLAIATSLLGVGAHEESPDVSSPHRHVAGLTEAPSYNDEERTKLNEVEDALSTNLAPFLEKVIDQPQPEWQPGLNRGRGSRIAEPEPSSKRVKTSQNAPLKAKSHHQITDKDRLAYHANHITKRAFDLNVIPHNVLTDEVVVKMKKAETGLKDAFKKKIRDKSPNVFKSGKLKRFIEKANDYINTYPDANLNLVELMGLDAKTLLDMADAVYTARPRRSVDVQEVLNSLHQSWSRSKTTPEELYLVLGLNGDENINFNSLRFAEWMDYSIGVEDAEADSLKLPLISTVVTYMDKKVLLANLKEEPKIWRKYRLARNLLDYLQINKGETPSAEYLPDLMYLINSFKRKSLKGG